MDLNPYVSFGLCEDEDEDENEEETYEGPLGNMSITAKYTAQQRRPTKFEANSIENEEEEEEEEEDKTYGA